jgi:hypothetical protein
MKVVVDPAWTFEEALNAAWKAYQGEGREDGATNRIRVLEQWANVVGLERATREFQAASEAGIDTGLSKYALNKLRRSFGTMPLYAANPPADLYSYLRWLARQDLPDGRSFEELLPAFVTALGYDRNHLFYEPLLGTAEQLRPDFVVADSRLGAPALIIEAKFVGRSSPSRLWEDGTGQVVRYLNAAKVDTGVLISPTRLRIVGTRSSPEDYDLPALTRPQAAQIQARIGRTSQSHPKRADVSVAPPSTAQIGGLLEAVLSASNNKEKKDSLESLAGVLLNGIAFVRCKHANLITRSSEIDIVCEYTGHSRPTLFDEHGRYFLIECKNWKTPIDAKGVRDFLGKLNKTRATLGIIFSRNGVTGTEGSTDGLREIHAAYDKNGTCILVIAEDDLRACENGEPFYQILDDKLDRLRFDL